MFNRKFLLCLSKFLCLSKLQYFLRQRKIPNYKKKTLAFFLCFKTSIVDQTQINISKHFLDFFLIKIKMVLFLFFQIKIVYANLKYIYKKI